ncbi:MAG TPA: serine hydrolase [Anaerolineae bacterium]|nr:serine hydrolase [Anaerolineae bacterium]
MLDTTQSTPLSRSTPEAQGVPSQAILALLSALQAGGYAMHSLMLLRHGHVIAEGCWRPYTPACRRYVYSLSKSFASTAVGLAVAEGLLTVSDPVVSFFPDDLPPRIDEHLAAMRLRHLLTMTAGHSFDSVLALLDPDEENWAAAILALPVQYPPGTHFLYNSGASYLLSAIVHRVTGQSVLDYLTPRLFQPLGITSATWDACPRGVNTGGWGLNLRTEDIARFGQLYLQRGAWHGEQLLPAAWVAEATAAQVPNDGPDRQHEPIDWQQGYGYQFWRCQHGAYRADGASGQFCVVMPHEGAVLAITSETNDMQGILDRVWQHLLPAMHDAPIPANPAAQAALHARLAELALPLPAASPQPPIAASISGRRFALQPNGLGLHAAAFSFDPGCCRFRLCDGRGEHEIVCGHGAWATNETRLPIMMPTRMYPLFGRKGHEPLRVAACGTWADAQTYVMTWQYLETPHADTVTCRFAGDELHLDTASSMSEPGNPLLAEEDSHFTGSLAGA